MTVAHHMKGSLVLGTRFLKKWFEPEGRPTKRALCQMILDGRIPGWVDTGDQNGTPWVDEEGWLDSWGRPTPPASEEDQTGLFLFKR